MSGEVFDQEAPRHLNTVGDHGVPQDNCAHETLPLMIDKWFRIGGLGEIEFHGYEAHEIVDILSTLSNLNADAVRYRPEE